MISPKLVLKSAALGLAVMAVSVVALVPVAKAEALITINPYENLSTTTPTTVNVSGTGLEPNSTLTIRQEAMSKVTETLIAVERLHKAVVNTDANGAFSVNVSVQYDVRTDLPSFNYCDNSNTLGRLCYLHLQYQTETNSEVIGQPKLYFGVSAPGPADTTGPVINVNNPESGATYAVGEFVVADYQCVDDSGIALCQGNEDVNGSLYTATPGTFEFRVNARDNLGNASTVTRTYTVEEEVVPPAGPVTKNDCKDDKWSNFVTLGFKNQGECVSSVAGKKTD